MPLHIGINKIGFYSCISRVTVVVLKEKREYYVTTDLFITYDYVPYAALYEGSESNFSVYFVHLDCLYFYWTFSNQLSHHT